MAGEGARAAWMARSGSGRCGCVRIKMISSTEKRGIEYFNCQELKAQGTEGK